MTMDLAVCDKMKVSTCNSIEIYWRNNIYLL